MGRNNNFFQVLRKQRYKKRTSKLIVASVLIAASLTIMHFVGLSYSNKYSEISTSVGTAISDLLVEDSYIYKNFRFKEAIPTNMSEATVVDWNTQRYQLALKITEEDIKEQVPLYEEGYQRRKDATFVAQVSNRDLQDLLVTLKQLEGVFNNKFKYPYVFLNIDEKYSSNFINTVKKQLPGRELHFEHVPNAGLQRPRNIDREREQIGLRKLATEGLVPTTGIRLLKNIFRYMSHDFFHHHKLQDFKWYWRFEPGTNFFNDIDYDVFQYMEDNNKTFGFTLATYEYDPMTVETLLPTTLKFLSQKDNMKYLHDHNAKGYLMENLVNPEKTAAANGYSTCHFWSSFEIGNLEFFRGEAYEEYFKFLDKSGGFYYDRWGDGPVHTMALSLLEDRDKLHWFKDISYEQYPFFNCPDTAEGNCIAGKFSDDEFLNLNCMPQFLQYKGK